MKHLYIMILVSILCFHANAQSSTTTVQQVDISLVNVITMTFVSTGTNTGSNININLSSMNNLQNGVTSTQQWLSVNSTKDFNVSAKCNATNFSYSGSYTQNTTMPVNSVLQLKLTANNTGGSGGSFNNWAYLSTTDQTVVSGGDNGYDKQFRIRYKAIPGLQYPAGVYSTQVVLTATQQ